MPRRSTTRASNLHASITTSPPPQHHPHSENLLLLRRQWKWAAFSQLFSTFSQLFAMDDVTISDIERDLVCQTNIVLSRIMQRLLYTLSYDRKISLDNWQSALRKQYNKRDPQVNPIGQEPKDTKQQTKDEDEESKMPVSEPIDLSLDELDGKQTSQKATSTPRDIYSALDLGASELPLTEGADLSRQSSAAQHRRGSEAGCSIDEDTEQETAMDWFDLPMITRLESIHTLAEWQFQNATRLRTIMKSDDEIASWRIEPIGYDSKRNAYWFIGGDRLWIQRAPPKPTRSQSLKRKRTSDKAREKAHPNSKETPTSKRPRLEGVEKHSSGQKDSQDNIQYSSGRQSRAAKDQAKVKLDVQAKELAKINREAALLGQKPKASRPTSSKPRPSKRVVGTRTSARLRGTEEDEWQPIPDEWLDDEANARGERVKSAFLKTGLESDQETISDLTELSEEAEEGSDSKSPSKAAKAVKNGEGSADSRTFNDKEPKQAHAITENFVEWETICVTLQEWERIAEQFEKATHYTEKALYKTLVNDIVPAVTQELREVERQRELEEALVHRKRSSRIALKESEREEARLTAKRKQEEEEKFSRTRRMEVRLQKEETERIKRENAREQRRKEREAREESRKAPAAQEKLVDNQGNPSNNEQRTRYIDNAYEGANGQKGNNSGSRTPAGDDWELSCEICQRQGVNLDDGTPMMSCGRCSKWQHILCHDRADQAAGRPRRNWDSVDFICKKCRNARQHYYNERLFSPNQHLPALNASQMPAYRLYQPVMIPPADRGSSPYMPAYREPAQQSYYVRPTNGHQHTGSNGQHTSSGQYAVAAPTNASRSTISFSHYQPVAQGFSGHKPYAEPQLHYGHPNQQYRPPGAQQYRPQTNNPAWNITTPAHAPGYSFPQNGSPVASSSTPYRNAQDERQGMIPMNESSQPLHRYPEQHYPSTQYPPTQFKHHPASYQSPLGR